MSAHELQMFGGTDMDFSKYLLNEKGTAPCALHAWGNQLIACPCGCRQCGLSAHRLAEKGLFGLLVHSAKDINGECFIRHIHPCEAMALNGMDPTLDFGLDSRLILSAVGQIASPIQVMWIMSAVSNHLASLRFGKCEFSAETHLHAYMSWLLMKCGMVWPQPDDAVCIEKFTSLAHCWQTVERLSLEELMFPQRWEHKIDGPVTIAAILDVLFRDAQSGQSSIVHSISDADCDMNEDETPWIDFPSVDHNGSDACIDAGFCTVIFDGDALAPVKLNPAVGTTLQELLLAHEKLVGTASIQQCVDASGQSLPLSHCLTVGELIYVKFDTNAVIPQAILTADETKATCLDTPVSPTAAWDHTHLLQVDGKPSIYDIGECSVALLKDQPEWLNAEPLTGLQGDQFLLLCFQRRRFPPLNNCGLFEISF